MTDEEASYKEESLDYLHLTFSENVNFGQLESPTTEGLLKIASEGASTWNTWIAAYPQNIIEFKSVNFSETNISFANFTFLNPDRSGLVVFIESKFKNGNFSKCNFSRATFLGCEFYDSTNFSNSTFLEPANFLNCHFYSPSQFRNSRFWAPSGFYECQFAGNTDFSEAIIPEIEFQLSKFEMDCNFSCAMPDESKKIRFSNFSGCEFSGLTTFLNRTFEGTCDFGIHPTIDASGKLLITRVIFKRAPIFHGCKFHQDTSFHLTIFKQEIGDDAARAYRTLKLAMEQMKATREEQRFFRLEMKAERPYLPLTQQVPSMLYEWCSDYGFSIRRPLLALFLFSIAIGGIHGLLANACADQPQCAASASPGTSDERTSDLVKYVLVNIAPVPGLDKMQTELRKPLFGEHGGIAIAAILLEILHKIIALIMTFLFALGLRNLFKMKS
ncbi:MAG: pentapeptide repeat-containing protein [Xanthomonadaceae bacterium]|nr:pentapeptide repeat-containing protein [Xanthomonadaceae bacterium]